MTTPTIAALIDFAQQQQPDQTDLDTKGVQGWLLDNIIPLGLLAIALMLLWLGGGKGDNAGVMRRLGGVIVALAVIGLAISNDAGEKIGSWLASLLTG
ncbi:hypothetical protein JOD54_002360 [Actinokineospora baliensis]|uniref:hypothetical protein n=1 Tax=Actinokineospora baliensis TaxID=547056 RepID=UPI001EF7BA61|nr:hypothetical protein [Actinokineospora baliensis]MBM7772156.1 hypothetical protein [Actinokineospora baliensis]